MAEQLEDALAWSLDAMRSHKASLEECLVRFPHCAAELGDLLALTATLEKSAQALPALHFRRHSWARIERRLASLPASRVTFFQQPRISLQQVKPSKQRRRSAMSWIAITSIVLSLMTGGGVGLAYAADGAVPGDGLYALDTAVESLQYWLTFDEGNRIERALSFADERLGELATILGKDADSQQIEQALLGYLHHLDQADQGLKQALQGVDRQTAESLKASFQAGLLMQAERLIQLQTQTSLQNQAMIEGALRLTQEIRLQPQEGSGDPAGPSNGGDPPGGQGAGETPGQGSAEGAGQPGETGNRPELGGASQGAAGADQPPAGNAEADHPAGGQGATGEKQGGSGEKKQGGK